MDRTRQRSDHDPRAPADAGSVEPDPPTVRRLVALADRLPHLVGVTDASGTVRWMNAAGRRSLGIRASDPIRLAQAFTPTTVVRYRDEIRGALAADGVWTGDLELQCADTVRVVEAVVVGEMTPGGELGWAAVLAVDVAEQRRRVADLSHRASHDPLTGLPNRALLEERLVVARSVAQRMGAQVALISLDLDGFKQVNDTHGHLAGDILLQQVTARLSAVVRPADTVARYGGDEFMVVLHPPESTVAAVQVAQRMRDRLRHPPYRVLDATVEISASVGLTVVDADDPADVASLIEAADRAMYRAKRSGGDRVRLAATDTAASDQLDQLDGVRAELVHALDADQFEPMFDPYLDARTGDVRAVAVVPTWRHPRRGHLDAAIFLEDAELTGHADAIGWQTATIALTASPAGEASDVPVIVPLSLGQIRDPELDDRLAGMADLARGRTVWVSVDEPVLAELEAGAALELATALTELGLEMALTEHGTGGLPLAVLAELPLRMLGIDRQLTDAARDHPRAVALATTLGSAEDDVAVAARGIASPAARDLLALLGVDWIQGPVTGGPVAADQLGELTRPRP